MLLLTLTPLLIISLILGFYLAGARIQDSETTLWERGDALARHLARESEFALFSEDAGQLAALAGIAVSEDDVYDVAILNADGKTVAHAVTVERDRIPSDGVMRDRLLLRFTAPVHRSGVVISDNTEQYREDPAALQAKDSAIGQVELRLSRSGTLVRQREIVRNIVLLALGSSLLDGERDSRPDRALESRGGRHTERPARDSGRMPIGRRARRAGRRVQ